VFDELFSHQLLLQLYGSISEVSLLIGGRAPVCWWSPSSLDALPSTSSITASLGSAAGPGAANQLPALQAGDVSAPEGTSNEASRLYDAQQQQQQQRVSSSTSAAGAAAAALQTVSSVAEELSPGSSSKPAMLVALDQEVDLVAIKFQGAQVGVNLGGKGFEAEVAMAALTMDDLLVGARCPGKAHMAESSVNWDQQQQEKQQQQQEEEKQQEQERQAAATAAAVDAQAPGGEEPAAGAEGKAWIELGGGGCSLASQWLH
jgi:hypothetical protein